MRVGKATAWNLLGLSMPGVWGLLCVPVLIGNLGKERFGLLGLLWALVGSAALLDLGLGRALTILVSRRLATNATSDANLAVRSGLMTLGVIGLIFTTGIVLLSSWLSSHIKETTLPHAELKAALLVVAPAVFLVIISSGVTCALEAFQRFDLSNAVRMLMGVGTIVGTTAASFFTVRLPHLAAVSLASRFASVLLGAALLTAVLRHCRQHRSVRKEDLIDFVRFGRWITFGNLLNPLLAYSDRLALSVLIPAGQIAYYLVPYDMLGKLSIFPGALVSSVLPVFSRQTDVEELWGTLRRSAGVLLLVMLPLLVMTAVLAHFGLAIWISREFADQSFGIAQILCVGVLFNSAATLPFALLQGTGWAGRAAIAQLCEVPLYLTALYFLGSSLGIYGIGIAWAGRMVVDCLLLWGLAKYRLRRFLRGPTAHIHSRIGIFSTRRAESTK